MPTLFIDVKPAEAAAVAEIQIDGSALAGSKLELEAPRRVHVSVIAVGFHRFHTDVMVDADKTLPVELAPRPHKKNRTLAVTLGMGAIGVIGWLVRRR